MSRNRLLSTGQMGVQAADGLTRSRLCRPLLLGAGGGGVQEGALHDTCALSLLMH